MKRLKGNPHLRHKFCQTSCVCIVGGSGGFISHDSITFCCLIKLANCIYCAALAARAGFSGLSELQIDLLSSKGLNQGAASNRLSEAHTEWLQAQIWSKKWRFAEWSWATAESELFDSGSKMSGRSKCTAGGDEESTKRGGEMGSHASHTGVYCGHTVTHTFTLQMYNCVSIWPSACAVKHYLF